MKSRATGISTRGLATIRRTYIAVVFSYNYRLKLPRRTFPLRCRVNFYNFYVNAPRLGCLVNVVSGWL